MFKRNFLVSCFLVLGGSGGILVLCYLDHLSNMLNFKIDIHIKPYDNKLEYQDLYQSHTNGNCDGGSCKGFILVSRYYEQQIGAAINLLSLSKWAKSVGAFPVEPLVRRSQFYNHVSEDRRERALYFHDYFDFEKWNEMCLNVGAMPLVSWHTFMAHNPKKLILVQDRGQQTSKLAFVNDDVMNETSCKEGFPAFEEKIQHYLMQTLNVTMEIVRRVCISFIKRPSIHINDFTDIVYGNLDPSTVVVWFQVWRGIQKNRIKIIESEYTRSLEVFRMIQSSKRIRDDSRKYIRNILKSDFGKYVAISFRSIQRAKYYLTKTNENPMIYFNSCISQLQKTVNNISTMGMVFLAQDLGRFGDITEKKYLTKTMITTIESKLFQSVYGGKLTIDKWEQQFVEITGGITESGYIAAMQSELLKNSGCLIMFGGRSNFQRNVLYKFQQVHSNNSACIYKVCYEP